jgi:hypothetical protein
VHDIIGQILFAVSREVPDVGEEDGEIKLLSFSSSYTMQLVKVQDNDVLWIINEPADDHVALDLCLARKAGEFVPASFRSNRLLDRVPCRNARDPIQDLDAAGCTAPPGPTLVKVRNSLPDRDIE